MLFSISDLYYFLPCDRGFSALELNLEGIDCTSFIVLFKSKKVNSPYVPLDTVVNVWLRLLGYAWLLHIAGHLTKELH